MQGTLERTFNWMEGVLVGIVAFVVHRAPLPTSVRSALSGKRSVFEEIVKFAMAGGFATVVYLVFFVLLKATVPLDDSSTIGTATLTVLANIPAILAAYLISAHYVFANAVGRRRRIEITMFFVMTFTLVALQAGSLWLVENVIVGSILTLGQSLLVVGVATLASWGLRFFVARRFIFQAHLERPPVDLATEMAHLVEEIDEGVFEERTSPLIEQPAAGRDGGSHLR